jgi:RNase adapter protein RapZ
MSSKRIIILSGMAGGGKSTAAKALEDLGFFVVDNLPPQLLETLIALVDQSGSKVRRLAFVVDAREATFLKGFMPIWKRLQASKDDTSLVFLGAKDDILLRRFKETRRRHPSDEGEGIRLAIRKEYGHLKELEAHADWRIDTSELSVHELKRKISHQFGTQETRSTVLTLMSFGFKYGLPPELDLCFDVRFLPNPFFQAELRNKTGLEKEVQEYVLAHAEAHEFLEKIDDMVTFLMPKYHHEGKAYITVAVGCTGGKHRSVTLVEKLSKTLKDKGIELKIQHRDREKS